MRAGSNALVQAVAPALYHSLAPSTSVASAAGVSRPTDSMPGAPPPDAVPGPSSTGWLEEGIPQLCATPKKQVTCWPVRPSRLLRLHVACGFNRLHACRCHPCSCRCSDGGIAEYGTGSSAGRSAHNAGMGATSMRECAWIEAKCHSTGSRASAFCAYLHPHRNQMCACMKACLVGLGTLAWHGCPQTQVGVPAHANAPTHHPHAHVGCCCALLCPQLLRSGIGACQCVQRHCWQWKVHWPVRAAAPGRGAVLLAGV